jgi:hypothetical protein
MTLIEKNVTDEHYEKIKEEIKKKASTYTMAGTKWEIDRDAGIRLFSVEPNEEISIVVNKVITKKAATFVAGLVSSSNSIPRECYNLWIITINYSGGHERISVTKVYANESFWEGTFSKDTIEDTRDEIIKKLKKSAEEKDQLKEVESHLKKYKEMMEGAANDCREIVNKEKNEKIKQDYKDFEEAYKAEILQVDKTINNWK